MARKHDVIVFHQLHAFNWIRIFSSIQFISRKYHVKYYSVDIRSYSFFVLLFSARRADVRHFRRRAAFYVILNFWTPSAAKNR